MAEAETEKARPASAWLAEIDGALIPATQLRQLFTYCPETGRLAWAVSPRNSVYAGTEAGARRSDGYRDISIGGRKYLAHRVVWAWVNGEWPKGCIDHINGVADDNRVCNLRVASQSENMANRRRCSRNSTGYKGVSADRGGRFRARIRVNGRPVYLGGFPSAEAAHCAYVKAAGELFGEFANAG